MTAPRTIPGYGWRKDLPDPRDRIYNLEHEIKQGPQLPATADLEPNMPPIYDQGQLGSCTANAAAALLEFRQMQQSEGATTPSRLFVYYEERRLEGSPANQDTGAEVRTGIKVLVSEGAPAETEWPYDIARFAQQPPDGCYQSAKTHEALAYKRIVIGPGAPMRTALAAGLPIAFGFTVPDYFETYHAAKDVLALPGSKTRFIGGHAVVVVGYDYSYKRFPIPVFRVRNSWGPSWGDRGHFYMDARYFDPFRNLADDLWVVSKVK